MSKTARRLSKGADFAVNAIQVGGYEPCTVTDFEIPKNTVCARPSQTPWESGIFRALRTIPVMENFARDMEEVCPDCLFFELHKSHGNADRVYAAIYR